MPDSESWLKDWGMHIFVHPQPACQYCSWILNEPRDGGHGKCKTPSVAAAVGRGGAVAPGLVRRIR